jgi:prepilin-type N-terminal cleavage/methylation domain-containing protein
MTRGGRHQGGITLIELVVVVAIIGILAGVAIFMFTRETRKAKATEVAAVFAEMKTREAAFYLENDTYLPTTDSDEGYFPSADPPAGGTQEFDVTDSDPPPEPYSTRWDGPAWQTLRFSFDRRDLACVYLAHAGDGGDDTNVGDTATGFGLGGTDMPLPAADWFYLLAQCDFDGDGTPSRYFTLGDSKKTLKENEGE